MTKQNDRVRELFVDTQELDSRPDKESAISFIYKINYSHDFVRPAKIVRMIEHQAYLKLQEELAEKQKLLDECKKVLEFYAPANSYDYDKTQGVNYIWNDQGKRARELLTKLRERKNDGKV